MASPQESSSSAAPLGFEAKLWQAADKLRGSLDAAEYKHVVLGLIFLKYISDAFEARRNELMAKNAAGYDPEDPDEYAGENVFWVPPEARWDALAPFAFDPTIGARVDDAMYAIELANPRLKGVLSKDYNRRDLVPRVLGEIVLLVGSIALGDPASRERDVLGRVYEYFLGQFAAAEGKRGGQFYTPQSVVKLLVEMLAPYRGRVFDPCCGSGGMFVQSRAFVEHHQGFVVGRGKRAMERISVYGQESNPTTWRLARMNLAIRGIDANLGTHPASAFRDDLHKDLKADFVMANPPFNDSDWGGAQLREDKRWKYGVPPEKNANYAWIQHFLHHTAPDGFVGFVMSNGSMSSQASSEGEIRARMVDDDLVDCMVALPPQLFYTTQIPVCLWFLARDKRRKGYRERSGETLFIDARSFGELVDRTHRVLSDDEIATLADTYHAWRGDEGARRRGLEYTDKPGFCRSATREEIAANDHVLTPGRYVGTAAVKEEGEPFEVKMPKLVATLRQQFAEGRALEERIEANLRRIGYGG